MLEATASLQMQKASTQGMHLGDSRYRDGIGLYMGRWGLRGRPRDMGMRPHQTRRSARPSPSQGGWCGVAGEEDWRTGAGESLYSQLWPQGGAYALGWISGLKRAPF